MKFLIYSIAKLDSKTQTPNTFSLVLILIVIVNSMYSQDTIDSIKRSIPMVRIAADKPRIEKTNEGYIVHLDQSYLSKSINSAELLSRIPGINYINNKVNIFGRGESIIILNGKETTIESFKSLAVSDIRSIEIITNPSAKYDAKGKAIILVHLKKRLSEGYSNQLNESVTISPRSTSPLLKYTLNSINLNSNFRKEKINLTSYIANELGQNWMENNFSIQTITPIETYHTKGYYSEDNVNKGVFYYKLGVGYDINKKTKLSAQYDGFSHAFNLAVKQNSDYTSLHSPSTVIQMFNDAKTNLLNHSINLNLNHSMDTSGGTFFLGLQHNDFQNHLVDHIRETKTDPFQEDQSFNRKNIGTNSIILSTAQMDVSKKFGIGTLEIGGKYYQVINEGKINFYSKAETESDYIENSILANQTTYQERVPAAYILYNSSFKNWRIYAGIRAEYTDVNGFSHKLKSNFIDSSYFDLFPSLKIGYSISQKWNMSLGYSRKINRPIYQDLDPFLWYLDSLTSIRGNPNLQPEYINQIETNLSYNSFTLRGFFAQSESPIWAIIFPGNSGENSVSFSKTNFQKKYVANFAFDIPLELKNYSCTNTISTNLIKIEDHRTEFKTQNISPQFYFSTYHQYQFPKLFSIEVSGEYYGSINDGLTTRDPYYYVSAGISRNLFQNNISLQLFVNDIFQTARFSGYRVISNYQNTYRQQYSTQYIRLTVQCKFGKLKNFQYTNKAVNEKEFNRIKK